MRREQRLRSGQVCGGAFEARCSHRVEAAVDKVAHEEVVGVGHVAADLEELLQVVKLPVDVAADRHRGIHALHIALLDKDLTGLGAQGLHLRLFDVLASLELFYLPIQIGTSPRHAQFRWRGPARANVAAHRQPRTMLLEWV